MTNQQNQRLPRLRDLEDDLGSAFRSASVDGPRPGAKAALIAALGVAGASAAATTTTTAAAAATAKAAVGVGAGGAGAGAGAGVVAKTSVSALAAKVIVGSALIVGGTTAATTYALRAPSHEVTETTATAATTATATVARKPSQAPPIDEAVPTTTTTTTPIDVQALPPAASHATTPAQAVAPIANAPIANTPIANTPPPATKPASAVTEELAELDRARAELAAGRASAAAVTLERYRVRFPNGVMQEEARVLEIEALARAGQTTRARELGAAFLVARPTSPLAPRVRRAIDAP